MTYYKIVKYLSKLNENKNKLKLISKINLCLSPLLSRRFRLFSLPIPSRTGPWFWAFLQTMFTDSAVPTPQWSLAFVTRSNPLSPLQHILTIPASVNCYKIFLNILNFILTQKRIRMAKRTVFAEMISISSTHKTTRKATKLSHTPLLISFPRSSYWTFASLVSSKPTVITAESTFFCRCRPRRSRLAHNLFLQLLINWKLVFKLKTFYVFYYLFTSSSSSAPARK